MVVINTFTVPVDGVVLEQADTRAYLNDKEIGSGTIYITESVLSWCDSSKHLGFSLQYRNIALHAARREPFPALYIMVDQALVLPEGLMPRSLLDEGGRGDNGDEEEEEGTEEDEGQVYSEMLFAPPVDDVVQRMFLAMNQCQMLHPDPDDDDPDSDIYEDASETMDDDNFEPVQPMDEAEESLQELHLGVNNGHGDSGDMNYDPEQFADD